MQQFRGCAAWMAACALLLSVACGSPPHKEMDQAQGAIDAARAAGAEKYAPTELAAAEGALKQAGTAVDGGDYRQALSYALESREQAQNAARTAADTRARLRGGVERSIAEVKSLIAAARSSLKAPASRVSSRARRTAEQRLAQAETDLQKAVAALEAEDYAGADQLLTGIKARIQELAASLAPRRPQPPRRRS